GGGVGGLGGVGVGVGGRNRDAGRLLFRRLVDLVIGRVLGLALLGQDLGDRRRERRLAVVDVPDRADVAVRLGPIELFLGHRLAPRQSKLGIAFCSSGGRRQGPHANFA